MAKRRDNEPGERYSVKHYVLRRGNRHVYEIPAGQVVIVDDPLVWPVPERIAAEGATEALDMSPSPRADRVIDSQVFGEFYKDIHPYKSRQLGFYWRGPVEFIDGSRFEIVIVESKTHSSRPSYSVALREPPAALKSVAAMLSERAFPSARAAAMAAERSCNRALYEENLTSRAQKKQSQREG